MIARIKHQCQSISCASIIFFCFCQPIYGLSFPRTSFNYLMSYALNHAPSELVSKSDIQLKQSEKVMAKQRQYIPSIHLDASMEKAVYDQPYNQNGINISNNGYDPSFGIGVDFDLQKLLGSSAKLAKASVQYSKLSEKIKKRELVRDVKVSYFEIKELAAEIKLYRGQIRRFSRINRILKQQSRLGVDNRMQRGEFAVQRGLLESQMNNREMILNSQINQMSAFIGMNSARLKGVIKGIKNNPPSIYADRNNLTDLEGSQKFSDSTVIANLSSSYRLDKLKFDSYRTLPLPTVYLKLHRDRPTMPSHAGPQTISVIGLVYPLDGFFIRSSEKSMLGAQARKSRALFEKALVEYRRAVRVNLHDLIELKRQARNLMVIRLRAKHLLGKSFLYYAQKRIDAFGTLDIFQKYLTTSKALLVNQLNMRIADSNLEYLLGSKTL